MSMIFLLVLFKLVLELGLPFRSLSDFTMATSLFFPDTPAIIPSDRQMKRRFPPSGASLSLSRCVSGGIRLVLADAVDTLTRSASANVLLGASQ